MESGIIGAGSSNGITRNAVKSAIVIDKISVSQFQKAGTETAMLRQDVSITSNYPSSRVSNDKQDNLFDATDFGFESNSYTSQEKRVAFLNVPVGTTPEQLLAKLAAAPEACLYKILSNDVILTEDQDYAIKAGLRSKDEFANSQVVRFPENHETTPNQIIKDPKGNVMYRQVFFSKTAKADEDWRGTSAIYASPEILAELEGTPASATLVAEQSL